MESNWAQRTSNAGWEGRAGLSSVVYRDEIYVFGGSKNDDSSVVGPGGPARIYFNDAWKSNDNGATWQVLTGDAPWEPRAGDYFGREGRLYLTCWAEKTALPVIRADRVVRPTSTTYGEHRMANSGSWSLPKRTGRRDQAIRRLSWTIRLFCLAVLD